MRNERFRAIGADDWLIGDGELAGRGHALEPLNGHRLAVVLPLDALFEIRAAAALQLWRAARGAKARRLLAPLTPQRRRRLLLGLQALDGHLEEASYRDIAIALFGRGAMPDRGWKTHDRRDQTIRLVRYGLAMMRGGYRQILLLPYRRKP